jgi:hypothetical protein
MEIKEQQTIAWDLIPNQYEYKMILVLSTESFHTICTKLNKHYGFDYREGIDYNKNDEISLPCCICNDDKRICAILIDKFTNSVYDQTTLTHELFHAMTIISENVGLKINQETTEAWAYFLSFYLKVCLECLKEHLKQSKKRLKNNN